jgi:hypothetical protein
MLHRVGETGVEDLVLIREGVPDLLLGAHPMKRLLLVREEPRRDGLRRLFLRQVGCLVLYDDIRMQ